MTYYYQRGILAKVDRQRQFVNNPPIGQIVEILLTALSDTARLISLFICGLKTAVRASSFSARSLVFFENLKIKIVQYLVTLFDVTHHIYTL